MGILAKEKRGMVFFWGIKRYGRNFKWERMYRGKNVKGKECIGERMYRGKNQDYYK